MFKNAIVRIPAENFADGLTTVDFGVPDFAKVLQQHTAYCHALQECGLELTTLPADLQYPDSTFVEDTAVLTEKAAILARPGAESRAGEVSGVREEIARFFFNMLAIEAPGTLDGGDICEAGTHFFLGLSQRSNEEGCRQLAAHLSGLGHTSSIIDVRRMTGILHLKSGIASIGHNTLVVMEEMADNPLFRDYELIRVCPEESYAANCVSVNERVLVPAGYPKLLGDLKARGFDPMPVEMSEFRKMDGGLSCLSLRL